MYPTPLSDIKSIIASSQKLMIDGDIIGNASSIVWWNLFPFTNTELTNCSIVSSSDTELVFTADFSALLGYANVSGVKICLVDFKNSSAQTDRACLIEIPSLPTKSTTPFLEILGQYNNNIEDVKNTFIGPDTGYLSDLVFSDKKSLLYSSIDFTEKAPISFPTCFPNFSSIEKEIGYGINFSELKSAFISDIAKVLKTFKIDNINSFNACIGSNSQGSMMVNIFKAITGASFGSNGFDVSLNSIGLASPLAALGTVTPQLVAKGNIAGADVTTTIAPYNGTVNVSCDNIGAFSFEELSKKIESTGFSVVNYLPVNAIGDLGTININTFSIQFLFGDGIDIDYLHFEMSAENTIDFFEFLKVKPDLSVRISSPFAKGYTNIDVNVTGTITLGNSIVFDTYISSTKQSKFSLEMSMANNQVLDPKIISDNIMPGVKLPDTSISLNDLELSLDYQTKSFTADIDVGDWKFSAGGVDILCEDVDLNVSYADNHVEYASIDARFYHPTAPKTLQEAFTDTDLGTEFGVQVQYNAESSIPFWEISCNTSFAKPLELSESLSWLETLSENFSGLHDGVMTLEGILSKFSVSSIGFSFKHETSVNTYNFLITGNFTYNNTVVPISLMVTKSGTNFSFEGYIVYNDSYMFQIDIESTATYGIITAKFQETLGGAQSAELSLQDLVKWVDPDIASDVPDISIDIEQFNWILYNDKSVNPAKKISLAGLQMDAHIDLSNIPVIGSKIPGTSGLSISNISVLASTDVLTATQAAIVSRYLPAVPADGLKNKLSCCASLMIGDENIPLSFVAGGASTVKTLKIAEVNEEAISPSPPLGTAKWLSIEKQLGPISFDKVGVTYANKKLYCLLEMSFKIGPLTISLEGLYLGASLQDLANLEKGKIFTPSFGLEGLGVSYETPELTLSGALIGDVDPLHFSGEISITAADFGITALGEYSTVNGKPSFFLFAILDDIIGGPPSFFVTGLAGGFGFNKALVLPKLQQINEFPFVQAVESFQQIPGFNNPFPAGNDPAKDLLVMDKWIKTEVGEDWVAAGITFTSYELLLSYAVVTVSFGKDFSVALLGSSQVSIPPDDQSDPVAFVQLDLEAEFLPSSGVFFIEGALTKQSFLFSRDCHLTGGFALYVWFGGPHEGQFVFTIGGYNTAFNKPAYYPQVPRLAFNWQVNGDLNIKGGMYFAVTSTAIMAGGYLEANWHSGNLKAWFDLQADFLIIWKPFHYDIHLSIHMGVSYHIHFIISKTITFHLGVDLHIWGPEFAGKAHIDLDIVSFTIRFGSDGSGYPKPIEWKEFIDSFLPSQNKAPSELLQAGSTKDCCTVTVSEGLLKNINEPGLDWLISGDICTFDIKTLVPVKKTSAKTPNVTIQNGGVTPVDTFGIGPSGISHDQLISDFIISIKATEGDSTFDAIIKTSNISKSLWHSMYEGKNNKPHITDPLNETTIDSVITGYQIVPVHPAPDHTLPVLITDLQYTDCGDRTYTWAPVTFPTTDSFKSPSVTTSIMNSEVVSARSSILSELQSSGLAIMSENQIDVSDLTQATSDYLQATPEFRLLGEKKSSS